MEKGGEELEYMPLPFWHKLRLCAKKLNTSFGNFTPVVMGEDWHRQLSWASKFEFHAVRWRSQYRNYMRGEG